MRRCQTNIIKMACSMKFICILGLILLTGAVVDGQGECGSSSLFSEALKLAQCVPTALTAQCCNLLWSYQQNPECLSAPFFVLTRLESSASRRMLSVPSPNYAFLTSISSVNVSVNAVRSISCYTVDQEKYYAFY